MTCTEETFAIKAHAQRLAAQLGLILITPDTSPRGEGVAEGDNWDIGQVQVFISMLPRRLGLNIIRWKALLSMNSMHWLLKEFVIHPGKIGIFGHSMGGHGALTLAFKYPEKFKSVSAFAPICAPSQCPWGDKAFSNYLGTEKEEWLKHDATALVQEKGALFGDILIDQGFSDQFDNQLNPALFSRLVMA